MESLCFCSYLKGNCEIMGWLVEKRALSICSLCSVYLNFFHLWYKFYLCVSFIFNHWFMGLFTVSVAVSFFPPQRYTALFLRSRCQTDVKMTCLQATMWFLFMFHQPLKTSQRCSAVRTYKAFLSSPRRLCIVQFPGLRFKYICNSCGHFCVLLLPHTYEFFHVSSLLILAL